MESAKTIPVTVVYALADQQVVFALDVVADATIAEVITQSGILEKFPEIEPGKNKVGVFGKLGKLTDTLHAGDRVEIYRPLIADPKQVRKQRAAEGKVMKKGAGACSDRWRRMCSCSSLLETGLGLLVRE
ncbi:MAG TPA: RnfH family protein [Gammaproteobacteria bacterium]|nr:RnfH family protein [Gammaproteobacteria bacterium]